MNPKLLLPLLLLAVLAPFVRADAPKSLPIATLLADWKDAKRNVTVPVKIYYPQKLTAAVPVIVVSHGLAGSRENMRYAGEYWAGHGYVSVHLQHVGSDTSVISKGAAKTRSRTFSPPPVSSSS